jgi:multidrug efflux pump subunit AcrA (membrane-fusion protein)
MTRARTLGLTAIVAIAALGVGIGIGRRTPMRAPGGTTGLEHTAHEERAPRQLWTCGMHPQVLQDHPGTCPICGMQLTPVEVGDLTAPAGAAGAAVRIDPVVVQNMGVRTTTVREGTLAVPIRTVGVLAEAEPARHDVNLRVSGWIERLHASTEGMHLAVGDPLFDLYSPELQAAVGELIAARRARDATTSGGGHDAAARVFAATARKLELYGLTPGEVGRLARLERAPRTVTFRSPIRGHLVEKSVVEGAAVEAGADVMRIVDHSRLWLDARVFEQDLPLVRLGQHATATLTALPGKTVTGEVIFIHPHLDDTTRTAMVRLEVANPSLVLRPGMYATVEIATDAPEPTVLVPREAVIDTGTRQIAFVAEKAGHFTPRELSLGTEAGGQVQVLAGLTPGEQVVTSGQFLLDAESRLREAIQKHLATGLAAPATGHEGHGR